MFRAPGKINPVLFFFIASLAGYILYTSFRPPMQSPDEFFHFCRAYQVSEGDLLPLEKDQRVGGELPVCIKDYLSVYMPLTFIPNYKAGTASFINPPAIECSDTNRVFIDFPNTSTYSPVAYLPHAFALFVLRQFHCPIGTLYYLSKLFAFLVYLTVMLFVIKITPVYKWLFVLVLLLPTNLYMMNSYTGDTMTNLLAFLLIALIFKHAFSERKLSYSDLLLILLIGMLLAFTKVIYVTLLLLLLMIPREKFGTVIQKYTRIAVLLIIPFLLANFWSSTVMAYYPTFETYNPAYREFCTIHHTADHHKQMAHLLENKTHIFKVIYNSVTREPGFYLRSYIAHFGTYLDTTVPYWFVITAFAVIILVSVFERNPVSFSVPQKCLMLGVVVIAYSLIIFSQHLVWNDVGSEIFPAFQGRYLATLFPLLFMLLNHRWQHITFDPALLVIVFILAANAYSLVLIKKRYINDVYTSKVDFSCGAEFLDKNRNLLSSEPGITLSGEKRTAEAYRSGQYAVKLEPDSTKGFIYDFKDLQSGDLVEIYAWLKGSGGQIVVQGEGLHCTPYRFVNTEIQLTEKSGWKKMQMLFTMPVKCDSSDVRFYVFNPTTETIYFDDIRYVVKKFGN